MVMTNHRRRDLATFPRAEHNCCLDLCDEPQGACQSRTSTKRRAILRPNGYLNVPSGVIVAHYQLAGKSPPLPPQIARKLKTLLAVTKYLKDSQPCIFNVNPFIFSAKSQEFDRCLYIEPRTLALLYHLDINLTIYRQDFYHQKSTPYHTHCPQPTI